jgi:hypothetical protein
MEKITKTVVSFERHEQEVEFELPCYRKWKNLRVYKVCAENVLIQVTVSDYLNPSMELVEGSVDRAFDRETEPATAQDFDEAFSKALGRMTALVHE